MKALTHPFQIYHSIIPVLPQALFGYIEAPVPLLIGCTKQQLLANEIVPDSDTHINWIDLDDYKNSNWSKLDSKFPMPSFDFLKDKIQLKYDYIKTFS